MKWTSLNQTQRKHDELKFEYICSARRNWWTTYGAYEVCNTFYRESQKVMTSKGKSVWQTLVEQWNEEADVTDMSLAVQERIYKIAADVLRAFKHVNPDVIVELIMLGIPRPAVFFTVCSFYYGNLLPY